MVVRLANPVRRKGTENHQFVRRIPADVRASVRDLKLEVPVGADIVPLTVTGRMASIRLSLRTSDPSEVLRRQAGVHAYLESVWQHLRRQQPVSLSHKQCVALGGELYRGWAVSSRSRTYAVVQGPDGTWHEDNEPLDDEPEVFTGALARLRETGDGRQDEDLQALEKMLGGVVNTLLRRKGILSVDHRTRPMLLRAFRDALVQALEVRQAEAGGDFTPDPKAARFPKWEESHAETMQPSTPSGLTLENVVAGWWVEAKATGRTVSTHESYSAAFKRLGAFLDHQSADRVTPFDIVRFKDHRLASGVSPKTVGDSDIAALRVVFGWAVRNLKLASNPAEGVRVPRAKVTKTRPKAFRHAEAVAILSHASKAERGRKGAKRHSAQRWVPWLCAYTGARLGEMVQLRKQDIRQEGDLWVMTITPEAGTVKDKEAREVVLHGHLVELGFTDFVAASGPGYLFLRAKPGDDIRGAWRGTKNRVTAFVREVVLDPNVAPNHGWRHLFKSVGREAGIADSVLDAICGHAAKSVGQSYGEVSLQAQHNAMAKFPRFKVSGAQHSEDAGRAIWYGGNGSDRMPRHCGYRGGDHLATPTAAKGAEMVFLSSPNLPDR